MGEAYTYGGNVDASLSTTWGQFTSLFSTNFGTAWNAAWTTQQNIPLSGRIQDVADLSQYDALVIPGGRGAVAYQYDGSYANLSPQDAPGTHVTTAAEVQAAAEKINALINEALTNGKLVAAQCHGAPLAAFARRTGTAGSGFDGLGLSVLNGGFASGYPLGDGTVASDYANLGITYLADEKLVLDGPDSPHYSGNGRDMILTSRDWFAETVAYLAATVDNILDTYPTPAERTATINVLVFGGDEPTNYWPQEPARYTDIVTLLNNANDGLNIVATGTSNVNDITLANLQNYDVLLYFRHDAISNTAQQAIVDYVAGGGGLVGLHHAIYNQGGQKQTLIDLFGAQLPVTAQLNNELYLVYSGESNHLLNVNFGNYVSTYGVHLLPGDPTSTAEYTTPNGIPNTNLDADGAHGYYHFTIPANDELYTGNVFNPGVTFGEGVNQINRIFSNDRTVGGSPNPNNGHYDAWGWTKLYNTGAGATGRIVYLQPGETADRTLADPAYAQVIRNGVVWASLGGTDPAPVGPTVVSIDRASANSTSAASVNYSVVFSENVTGVDLSDFALVPSGVVGASITNVSGSDANYTVTVNTGSGSGSLRLDLDDDNSILNGNSDPLGGPALGDGDFSGQTYTVTKTSPALLSPTNGEVLHTLRPFFDWTDHPGAIGYQIQVSRYANFSSALVNVTLNGATNSQYTPTKDLPVATLLYWRVRPRLSAVQYGTWVPFFTFITASPPSIPSLVSPANNALLTNLSPTLDWNDSTVPAGITFSHYQVQFDDNADFSSTLIDTNVGVSTLAVGPLNTNTQYFWRVRSWNTIGDASAWSATRTFREAILPPTLLSPIGGIATPTRRPTFDWSDVAGATGYTIQVSLNVNFSFLAINVNINSPTSQYTPGSNLQANRLYYWRVRANGPNGPSVWSIVASFSTP